MKSNFKFQFAQVPPRSWVRTCGPLWISTSTGMVRITIFPPERQMSCSFFHFLSHLSFLTGSWSASSKISNLKLTVDPVLAFCVNWRDKQSLITNVVLKYCLAFIFLASLGMLLHFRLNWTKRFLSVGCFMGYAVRSTWKLHV